MAAKIFEVGDVLPQGIVRISWNLTNLDSASDYIPQSGGYAFVDNDYGTFKVCNTLIYSAFGGGWLSPYTNYGGGHNYIDIDMSFWSESSRTITSVMTSTGNLYYWELAPQGFSITFEENGGTTISDIEEATELPTPLPTPTKSGYTFVAWYYESNFQTRAVAGETIEEDTTLYAKWHNLGSLFTEIADAIRSKDGTSENIRDVDFGERIKQIQGAKEEETKTVTPNFSSGNQVITPTSGKVLSQVTLTKPTDLLPENIAKDKNVCGVVGTSFIAIELTQAQYDALSTKDSNTYYLIVEE